MSYGDTFVGSLAILISVIAAFVAAGYWNAPYQLRTISAVSRRFGKTAARCVWIAIAVASFTAGMAIIKGMRPSYAVPAHQSVLDH